jgi:hypothetical protein
MLPVAPVIVGHFIAEPWFTRVTVVTGETEFVTVHVVTIVPRVLFESSPQCCAEAVV